MRQKILIKLAEIHSRKLWLVGIVALLITIILTYFAGNITVNPQTSDVMPAKDPKVIEYNKVLEEFKSATNLVVVIQGEEKRVKEYADRLAPMLLGLIDSSQNDMAKARIKEIDEKIKKLKKRGGKSKDIAELLKKKVQYQERINKKLFQRVDYKLPIDFLKKYALLIMKEDDLKNMQDLFSDPGLIGLIRNINNSMESEYIKSEEGLSTREAEDNAINFLHGIGEFLKGIEGTINGEKIEKVRAQELADKLLFGDNYIISYDRNTLIMTAIPNFSIMDRDLIMSSARKARELLDKLKEEFPDVRAGLTGQIAREYDEQTHSEEAIGFTTLIAFIAILILLIVSFRMIVAPVFAIINLVIGVIWAMGITYLVVGELNIITSMMSIVLIGIGIDFSIHIISTFTEFRGKGETIENALKQSFLKSGKGIITGAITTACAFFMLMISQSRGLKELGLVVGLGLIVVMICSFLVLPIFLVLREKRLEKKLRKKKKTLVQRDITFRSLGKVAGSLHKNFVLTIVFSIVISATLFYSASKIQWDFDFRKMEPKGLESLSLVDTTIEKFGLSMEYAFLLTESIEESKHIAEKTKKLPTVAAVGDISQFLPSKEEQNKRRVHIEKIKNKMEKANITPVQKNGIKYLIKEIERLKMNIMELQDMAYLQGLDRLEKKCVELVGSPEREIQDDIISRLLQKLSKIDDNGLANLNKFQGYFSPYFKKLVLNMCNADDIDMEDIPESILDRYCNNDRTLFLVTAYPSGDIYNGDFMKRFVSDLNSISERYTGMAPLSYSFMVIMGREGRNAIFYTLIAVFVLLWIDFGSPFISLMAMIPLGMGFFWMVGFMNLVGMKLNMMNVIGLPLIIGIGIDDGVHIIHRWQTEGRGKIKEVFSSTGKGILLTSLTTMLAFGSMVFSVFPAWGMFGMALFIGVGMCFITTVLVIPGFIGLIEKIKNR